MKHTHWIILSALLVSGAAWGQAVPLPATPLPSTPPVTTALPVEMPVRGGEIVVKVAGYEAARQEVLQAAGAQGAELLAARTLVDGKGRKYGWLQFRLLSQRLPLLLASVQAAGKLYGENIATTDHASEYEELARRIGRLREHEARLSGILQSSRRLRGGDLLYVQERLFRASVDESLLAQRRADLERDTRVNTLQIELFEPGALPAAHPTHLDLRHWFFQALGLARGNLERLLARGLTAGAYGLVYAPLWLPILVLFFLLLRWLQRRARSVRPAGF